MKLAIFFSFLFISLEIGFSPTIIAQNDMPPRSEADKIIRDGHDNLIRGNHTQTLKHIQTLQKQFTQLPLPDQIGFLVLLANYYNTKYLIDSALTTYQKALEVSNLMLAEDPILMHLHLSIGNFYLHLGIADVALVFFQKAIQISRFHTLGMPILDAQMGVVRAYLDLKQVDLAKKNARESLELAKKIQIKKGYILTHYWLGVSYEASNQLDSAQYFFTQIEKLPNNHPRDNHLKAKALERKIKILSAKKNYAEAEKQWTKFSKSVNDSSLVKHLLLAKIYAETNRKNLVKPILDSMAILFKIELKKTQSARNLKEWLMIYNESLNLHQVIDNQLDIKQYQTYFTPILDSLKKVNDKAQNLILRKLSIYTSQYYDQQRQIRDGHARLMNVIGGGSFLILLVLLLGGWQYYRRRMENQRQNIEFKTAEAIILQYEIAEAKRKEGQLKKEIELQKADITDLALENTLKNKQTHELLLELKDIKGELRLHEKNNQTLDNLIKDLRNRINANERRDMLLANIDKVNHDFYERLSHLSQELTQTEKEFCGLLRLQLSSKEIAILRNITPKAVKMARYRLRKKLNLPSDEDMYAFIASI